LTNEELLANAGFVADCGDTSKTREMLGEKYDIHPSRAQRLRIRARAGVTPLPVAEIKTDAPVHYKFVDTDGTVTLQLRATQVAQSVDDVHQAFKDEGRNPDLYDFAYKFSKWENGAVEDNGSLRLLHAGGATAKLKPATISSETLELDIEAAQVRLRAMRLPQRIPGSGLGAPVAAVCNIADMQGFKNEKGGITPLLDRMEHGLENFDAFVKRQRATGRNIDEVVIVNNGDPFEGIAGNYANQNHTVMGGLRAQMNMVLDVWEMYSRELYPQFDKGQFVSVHCNHTQFGRQGGASKAITGDEDSGSAFLAEALQRILRGRDEFDHVKFTIPDDEMNVYANIAGVPVGFNHGHKIPGNDAGGFEKWLNGQVRGDKQAYEAELWITAHKHHYASWDMGSAWVFQCPSCEKDSKWLRDMNGRFSRSGILALLVGRHDPVGWSDQAFL